HRRTGRGHYSGAQPPERRPVALDRRPGGDGAARVGRTAVRHTGSRPRHHRSRTLRQFRGDRFAVTATALKSVIPGWDLADDPALDRLDTELLTRAYQFGRRAHEGQKRSSGDDYVSHCVAVAKILAELHLDSITVASGLIHDVVENYRKLLLSIAKDIRVILIKLADRLHNMRTLDYLPEEKRRRIAQETMDLYAPMAHRFGMARVRWELEDLSFKHLESIEYKKLAKLVAQKRGEREKLIAQFAEPLERELK